MIALVLAAALADAGEPVAPPAAPIAEPSITLLAAGDVTLGQRFQEMMEEHVAKDGWTAEQVTTYAFAKIGETTRAADVFAVNLECPFSLGGAKIEKNFAFRARPDLATVLLDGGVDAVSLANNHMYDYGPDALLDTLATVDANKLVHFGAGKTLGEARTPGIVVRNGIRIAFLGYFFLGDNNIEPPVLYADLAKPGVAGCFKGDECIGAMVEEDVKNAQRVADVVVPFFHWGKEAQDEVFPYQHALAHRAIDAGAKLVLGSHPHVVHGIERYKGVPVVYSLGNFVFGGNWGPKVETSIAVKLQLTKAGVTALEVLPMKYTNPPDLRFQPRWLAGDEAVPVMDRLKKLSDAFDDTWPTLR